MSGDKKILVGKIAAPQGLHGEFRVRTFTETPADLAELNAGVKFVRAAAPNIAICRMDGVNDRAAAEKLCGTELFVGRDELPPIEDGRHYIADLIGMKVIGAAADSESHVAAVHNFGAGDILELDNGQMISFNGAAVDYEKKCIRCGA
jgi:16S rRNA processing protein RimM